MLVLGGPEDAHARAVEQALRACGAEADYLDLAQLPSAGAVSLRLPQPSGQLRLPSGRTVALEGLRAVFWRLVRTPRPPAGLRPELHPLVERDTRRAVEAFLAALPCPVVNPAEAVAAHRLKPTQLAVAAALGLPVPATLVSNDPSAVRRFAAEHPAGVVVKPVGGGAYARLLQPQDLQRHRDMAACPMQYQAYVPGQDVRVYVIGEQVLAGRIVRGDPGPVDFRRDPHHRSEPIALSAAEARRCVEVARALGQRFSGLDFRHNPRDGLVFLEANPSPMFLRFQADTGLPVLPHLVELLLSA
ncbi:MAG: hypothetical protein NZ890_02085 [Myxococcota bacterium]|nr:hypothetical protein [Myxococcota bacterium]